MKVTIPQLKKKLNSIADRCGYAFDKRAPYYCNRGRVDALRQAIQLVKDDGEANPSRRYEISEKQLVSLNNWVKDLEIKYCR